MVRTSMRGVAAAFVLALAPVAARAQQTAPQPAPQVAPRDTTAGALQARVRQRIAAVMKQRLHLTDDQLKQLAAVNANYEGRRRDLLSQERDARIIVRAEVARAERADQKRVETAMTDLFRLQRARIDLAEQEQRDLAKFMQPAQRAGYLALQEQLRRRVEQMRERRQAGGPGGRMRPGQMRRGQMPPGGAMGGGAPPL